MMLLFLFIAVSYCLTISDFLHLQSGVDLIDLHKNLVTIDSLPYKELDISLYLQDYLQSRGLTVELQEVLDYDGFNVYAYLGSQRDTKVLLTSHLDTVPPYLPYFINDGKIYGRGSSDAKASVASQVKAFSELMESGDIREGDVAMLFVIGEESSGKGMLTASAKLCNDWDSVIFAEPTENKLGIGHKGVFAIDIKVSGEAGHSGYPELGRNANAILIELLYKIQTASYPSSPLLGNTTVNVGYFEGGVASNVISDHLELRVSVRVAAELETIESKILSIIDQSGWSQFIQLQYMGTPEQSLDFNVPGFETAVMNYGTDIPHLQMAEKTKKYLYGPGSILVAHGDDEYVEIDSLYKAVEDFKRLVKYSL